MATILQLPGQQSNWILHIIPSYICLSVSDYAREEEVEQGLEQCIRKGMEQGELRKALKVALEIKQGGEHIDIIIKYTQLSKEQINAL